MAGQRRSSLLRLGAASTRRVLAAVPSSRTPRWLLDPLVLGCLAVLIAFPFAATVAASRQPLVRAAGHASGPPAASRGPTVRDLPAFTPGGPVAGAVGRGRILTDLPSMRRALRAAMAGLFDRRERAALEALLGDQNAAISMTEPRYPFRYPRLERVLDAALPRRLDARQMRLASDLGALLVLAAARFGNNDAVNRLPTAAPLAYALLDRARAGGACLPQLNLAFLLSTDERPRDDATAAEFGEAERRCTRDPTPLWLLGQFRSQRALFVDEEGFPRPARQVGELVRRTFATFARLERRFPGSSAGWSGEADAELRLAYQLDVKRPFTARSHFRRALSLYRRARRLDPDPALAPGLARAYAGLRLYAEAARAQRVAIGGARSPGPLQARRVEYLERDRRFGPAATAAATLAAAPRLPHGPGLLMRMKSGGALLDEDGQGPLSLGSDRLLPVSLEVAPVAGVSGGGGGVLDLSFIPTFRHVDAVTGYDRWCPGWLYRRDLVLAGQPRQALAGLPDKFRDIRWPHTQCPVEGFLAVPLLAGLAELEAGNRRAAIERLRAAGFDTAGRRPIVVLLDARQNMWRFAGDLDRARAAAAEWTREAPASPVAFDRAGEIAFLAKDYGSAARLFAKSARLARAQVGTWSTGEAEALLKQGASLELAKRYREALTALTASDEVATRLYGLASRKGVEFGDDREYSAYLSYNARLQAGDTYLRTRRYEAADEQYAAAREWEPALSQILPGEPLRRPEVLDNNQALVEIELGRRVAGLQAARRAVAADPLNPIFLQTLGFALERLKQPDRAAAEYRRAVRADPTLYPAWNDLGVVRARQGRLGEAATAFRHAVGVRSDYSVGWFNLGVALERLGPTHALASEGALARAIRADSSLRGRERSFIADNDLYFTTLDLSKPLPSKWQFAMTEERSPVAAAGFAVALLLGLQLGRTLAAQGTGDAKRWLSLSRDALARLPRGLSSTAPVLAAAATTAVFLIPLLRAADGSLTSALLLGLGVGALIAIVLRSRVLMARSAGVALRQRGWPPGMLAGLGLSLTGLVWAPLPVAETDRPAPAVHWIGPIATGVVALILLALGVALEVPLTRALGTAALIMTASLLTPLEPLDGGFIAKGPAGAVAGIALLGSALFLLFGLS